MKVLCCISGDLKGFNSFYLIRGITPKMLYLLKNTGVEVPLGIYLPRYIPACPTERESNKAAVINASTLMPFYLCVNSWREER